MKSYRTEQTTKASKQYEMALQKLRAQGEKYPHILCMKVDADNNIVFIKTKNVYGATQEHFFRADYTATVLYKFQ
jgi:hypothetical protein